jgi:citrate lyase acyl carrier protein
MSDSGQRESVAEAGRRGSSVRSDCWISIRDAGADEPQVEITSRVGALFGASIEKTVRDTLQAMGLTGVHVAMEDQGALPWVLEARTEGAALRYRKASGMGGLKTGLDPRPPRTAPLPSDAGSAKDRLRRSRL